MPEPLSTTHSLEQLREAFASFNDLGFVKLFDARCEIVDLYRVRTRVDPVTDRHRGGIQGAAVNGGILSAMFDLALGLPGLFRAHPASRSATVQLSLSFMRAVHGDVLNTESWIARAGAGLLFTQAEATDEKGRVCATGSGVVRLLSGYSGPRTF